MAKKTLAEIKKEMGYEAKPLIPDCSNCKSFFADLVTMDEGHGEWEIEKNFRCTFIKGRHFKVSKRGKCMIHQFKKDGEKNV